MDDILFLRETRVRGGERFPTPWSVRGLGRDSDCYKDPAAVRRAPRAPDLTV